MSIPGEPAGERPRPQFGEYASPEEQAARIRHPLPAAATPWPESDAPDPVEVRQRMTNGRLIDRAVAVALLAYGLLSVGQAIPLTLDPRPLLEVMGLDSDTITLTSAGGWGVAAMVALIGGWLLTAWLTWRAHRRGFRSVLWIPLVGGFVANLVSGLLITGALLSDPAILDAVLSRSGS
ncbi:DUF6264 family protein [Microbacterium stercoris]|uniref:Uncharacterized protein n=1 Tax=Microbacterium stercoris TaxID=2820289 RepID=A0A939QIF2_9MICO|nr:DUF6264 family protein [Microbacterium stercoris]MBO3662247.1 hypothetical protein [Microbacterium stercoris]